MKDDVFPTGVANVLDDIEAVARPPVAPLAMPKQRLEAPVLAPLLSRLAQALFGPTVSAGR